MGGGGGGGRIAIYVSSSRSKYTGTISAAGGLGNSVGSAGTVFIKDLNTGTSTLIMDNNRRTSSAMSVVTEPYPAGPLNNMQITGGAAVSLQTSGSVFSVNNFIGDNLGTLSVSGGSILWVNATTTRKYNAYQPNATVLSLSHITINIREGLLLASDVEVGLSGVLGMSEHGRAGISTNTTTSQYTFDHVTVGPGGQIIFDYQNPLLCEEQFLRVKLVANTLVILANGSLHSDGKGYAGSWSLNETGYACCGKGYGGYGSCGGGGGGYGGIGGVGADGVSGLPYGNFTHPLDFGSGGGGAFTAGGGGGGIVYTEAGIISLTGRISSDGSTGNRGGAAGGSGGSVLLFVGNLTGTGVISASGGNGRFSSMALGGGGSGGRIAIHSISSKSSFYGSVVAYGGQNLICHQFANYQFPFNSDGLSFVDWLSTQPVRAGAGSIFWQYDNYGHESRNVIIDNSKGASSTIFLSYTEDFSGTEVATSQTFSVSDGYTEITFDNNWIDEVSLSGKSELRWPMNNNLQVKKLSNDGSSTLNVITQAILTLPHNYTMSSDNILLDGHLVGAQVITLTNNTIIKLLPNATWHATSYDTSYQQQGSFNISTLIISKKSGIILKRASSYEVTNRPTIVCDILQILDNTSYISATGQGYEGYAAGSPSLTLKAYPNFVASGTVTIGDGGWHAGLGGGGVIRSYNPYGNAFRPVTWGAAGGSTYQSGGGSGGGAVRIIVQSLLQLEGHISADGTSCQGTMSGGGAGGSVWISVSLQGVFRGSKASITAKGGNGCRLGGGAGSGGRIAVHASQYSYTGSYSVASGWQSSSVNTSTGFGKYASTDSSAPAGGTLYVGDSSGSGGILLGTNHGSRGSSVYAVTNDTAASSQIIADIIVTDNHMILGHGWNIITRRLRHLAITDTLISSSAYDTTSAIFELSGGSKLKHLENLLVQGYQFFVNDAKVTLAGGATIGSNGTIKVSQSAIFNSIALSPTGQPTGQPTSEPTSRPSVPTGQPTGQPSFRPVNSPTGQPTGQPSSQPTTQPTSQPSSQPTRQPSAQPTSRPSHPTGQPSSQPTVRPSAQPSTQPSSQPSSQPTGYPSSKPTSQPTGQPTQRPSKPSVKPTGRPSSQPSSQPTGQPSSQPSSQPTSQPSAQPTSRPSHRPSSQPTSQPTGQPTAQPKKPSSQPTGQPSAQPSAQPTGQPSSQPTGQPSGRPSAQPTGQPTSQPSGVPSGQPTDQPTMQPSSQPTVQPTGQPSEQPTAQPSAQPSSQPTSRPIGQYPSSQPSSQPTSRPSRPTGQPSSQPTGQPSAQPTGQPSSQPTGQPSRTPSAQPTTGPTGLPTSSPSIPTGQPTTQPTTTPSSTPTAFLSFPATFKFVSLELLAGGSFTISPQESYTNDSVSIVANYLNINAGGLLSGTGAITSSSDTWDSVGVPAPCYGASSNGYTGGAGGGNAGLGTYGSENSYPGQFVGYAMVPRGAGGPGGNGPRGSGGSAGAGLHLVILGDMIVDGVLESSGSSALVNSGAGGGAGGSIHLEVYGSLSGAGSIIANGGHGGVSLTSALHGGAGSGGRIVLDSCTSSFQGTIQSLGGLTIVASSAPLQSEMFPFDFLNQDTRNQYSYVTAGAAGTVVIITGSGSKCTSYARSHFTTSSTFLRVYSWSNSYFHAQVNTSSAITAIASVFKSSIGNINVHQTAMTTFAFPEPEIVSFNSISVKYAAATLCFVGLGTVSTSTMAGTEGTTMIIQSYGISLSSTSTLTLTNISYYLSGSITGSFGLSMLSSTFYVSTTAQGIVSGSTHPFLLLKSVSLRNSTIMGTSVYLNASSIDLSHGSAITSDAMGPLGRGPGGIASGIGRGSAGDTGGSGGGHGGRGMSGVNALYEENVASEWMSSSGVDIDLSGGLTSTSGGVSYGDPFHPLTVGSGGGASPSPYGRGGRGGGAVLVTVSGALSIDSSSRVSSDGESVYGGGGGGSGGSVYIIARGGVTGTGSIHANGGSTCKRTDCSVDINTPAGGGGGGRIRIIGVLNRFSGNISAILGSSAFGKDALVQSHMGSICTDVTVGKFEGDVTFSGPPTLKVTLWVTPMWMVQTITTSGTGVGSNNAATQLDAIVRGFWKIGYR